MKVIELSKHPDFSVITMPGPEREIENVYIGDLLSWVMGKAQENDGWITIMSNINVVAVASLSDVSSVILAEGVTLDGEVKATAEQKGINVLTSSKSAYEISKILAELI